MKKPSVLESRLAETTGGEYAHLPDIARKQAAFRTELHIHGRFFRPFPISPISPCRNSSPNFPRNHAILTARRTAQRLLSPCSVSTKETDGAGAMTSASQPGMKEG